MMIGFNLPPLFALFLIFCDTVTDCVFCVIIHFLIGKTQNNMASHEFGTNYFIINMLSFSSELSINYFI